MTSYTKVLTRIIAVALGGSLSACVAAKVSTVPPDAGMMKLEEGNRRYAASPVSAGKPTAARRAETAQSQHPFAVIVACADSRTSPEIVFDQSIGDLFVVRTAGNLAGEHALGSIEYAVVHLGVRLVVVLGHERCGAVTAALAGPAGHGSLGSLVRDIQPAVEAIRSAEGDSLVNAVAKNAELVAAKIRREAEFGEMRGKVRVVAAVYDLDTGKIEWLDH